MLIKEGLKDYSFCSFGEVKDRLIDCAAKKRLPQQAETVIMFLFPYKTENRPPVNLSRYASVPDYHTVCGNMLRTAAEALGNAFPDKHFEYFVDNSPIPEVHAASAAGLGLKGDNGLLISRKYGSFVFIGEIVTDMKLPCYSEYMECIHCGKCRKACPVVLDKRNCISAISQKKGELNHTEAELLRCGGSVWGCDICAEACPFNKYAQYTYIKEFTTGYRDCFCPDENTEGRPYMWRGTEPIIRNSKILG